MDEKNAIEIDERDPWDQQPDEPALWYARFDIYRILGPGRSIAKAYRKWRTAEKGGEVSSSARSVHWYDKAKEWNWERRAQAWDEVRREALEDEAVGVFSDGLSLTHVRVSKLSAMAQRLEEFIMDPRTTRISPHVIEQYRGLLDDIAKERGERVKETRVTGANGGNIVIETQWGRGGGASNAWEAKQITPPEALEAIVEEVKDDSK